MVLLRDGGDKTRSITGQSDNFRNMARQLGAKLVGHDVFEALGVIMDPSHAKIVSTLGWPLPVYVPLAGKFGPL